MERKLSVGDTISRTFSIYRDQAGVLLPVAFWLFLAVAVLEAVLGESLAILAVALLTLVLTFLYQGMVVGLVRDVQDGRRDNSIKELVLSVLPVLMPLIGAGILTAIGILFGFILLVVPGLFLLTIWAVTAPVIVVERRGVFDSLGRSRQLVRGHGWPVLGAFLLAILISIVASFALSAVGNALSDTTIMDAVFYAFPPPSPPRSRASSPQFCTSVCWNYRASPPQFRSSPATAWASRSPRAVSVYSVWGGRPGTRWRLTIPASSSCSSRSDRVVGETPGSDWRNSLKRAAPLAQA